MANCNYCSNYWLNGNNRADNSCMGKDDVRKLYFSCNDKLNPNKSEIQKMIEELEKSGYKVSKTNSLKEKN